MSAAARAKLKAATDDLMKVGTMFVIVGCVPMLFIFLEGTRDTWRSRLLAVWNSVILVGPGVWYITAALMMRRLNRGAVTISARVGFVQLVLVPASLVVGGFFARDLGVSPEIFVLPAFLAVFFVPALIAALVLIRRARDLMNEIAPEGHGFEPLPVQVLPPGAAQPTDSEREK